MTGRSFDEDELLQLLGAVRDEQITPEQAARLESILSQDAEARRFYLRFLTIHGLLEQAAVVVAAAPSVVTAPQATTPSPARRWRRRLWPVSLAAAVMIGVASWWLLATRTVDDGGSATPAFAWKATPTGDARFEQTGPTSLRLDRGEVRIQSVKRDAQEREGALELAPMTVETPGGKATIHGSDILVGTHESTNFQEKGATGMKHFTRVLVLAGVATLVTPHGSITGEANSLLAGEPDRAPAKQMVEANSGFAVDLYRQLTTKKPGDNLFISPYSISLALAMAAEGARGATADEMGKTLHFPRAARRIGADAQLIPWQTAMIHTGLAQISRDLTAKAKKNNPFQLRIANALWGELTCPLNPEFVKTLNASYGVGAVFPCDFANNAEQERQRINRWVSDQTSKRIENLLPQGSVNSITRMVLTNAIYFKGDWLQKFDKRMTTSADFTTLAGKRVKTPMMFSTLKDVKFAFVGTGDASASLEAGKADNFRLVEMRYKGGLSMVLIAPDNAKGLPALEARLTTANLSKWLGHMRAEEIVEVRLPRFKFTTEHRLAGPLRQLGMVRAFESPGPNGADFSGMSKSGQRDFVIGDVYHKAFVAVNEEGTEAAAATGVGLAGGEPKPPPRFAGDRPFLFLIRDPASQIVLFMGRITDAAGIANNDRSDADENSIKLARTAPTRHPLYAKLKEAAGVALIRAYRDPSGNLALDGDGAGGIVLPCRAILSLKGELKPGSIRPLLFTMNVQQSEAGQAFCDFFSKSFGSDSVVATYRRQGNRLVVDYVVEADEPALLVASSLFSIPIEKLSAAVKKAR